METIQGLFGAFNRHLALFLLLAMFMVLKVNDGSEFSITHDATLEYIL